MPWTLHIIKAHSCFFVGSKKKKSKDVDVAVSLPFYENFFAMQKFFWP